jgi:hypothetical protein
MLQLCFYLVNTFLAFTKKYVTLFCNRKGGIPIGVPPHFIQGYKDSNLEMLESESSALPFGDSPSVRVIIYKRFFSVNENLLKYCEIMFRGFRSSSIICNLQNVILTYIYQDHSHNICQYERNFHSQTTPAKHHTYKILKN